MKTRKPYAFFATLCYCVATCREVCICTTESLCFTVLSFPQCTSLHLSELNSTYHSFVHSPVDLYLVVTSDNLFTVHNITNFGTIAKLLHMPRTSSFKLFIYMKNNGVLRTDPSNTPWSQAS